MALIMTLLAVGCTGNAGADPTPSPTPTAVADTPSATPTASPTVSPSPTVTPTDSFAVPDDPADIDVDYVQHVLADGIYPVEDQAIRVQVEAASAGADIVPEEALDLLKAIYDGDQLVQAAGDAAGNWEDGAFVANFLTDPRPVLVSVDRVDDGSEVCIIATFTVDFSPRVGGNRSIQLTALFEPKPADTDPDGVNPTPWVITRRFTTDSLHGEPSC